MIMMRTKLQVADNTGAKVASCIQVLGGSKHRYGRIGDIIIANVKKVLPTGDTKKGDVVRGVIVRTKSSLHRPDGTYVRFDRNAMVILDEANNPKGTRVFGVVPRELRQNFMKIISLATEVV
ncbi:MAG: 50S ribosomal protein L14 [Planctomycetota bacterium]|nr:50S ribosomal protein L14 [Planctomycetota bacterium]MDI6786910.1 50S ribosomal protein L14 [Planctomycetota bacterium]